MVGTPVDGFTVTHVLGNVILTLSDRYGASDRSTFPVLIVDAAVDSLIKHAELAPVRRV